MARRTLDLAPDDGDANTESQQMMAVAQLLKQPKSDDKEMQQLHARAQADQKRLKTLLDQRMRQAERQAKERRDEITASILGALNSPNQITDHKTTTIAGTKIADNTTYMRTSEVLAQSESLVGEYERLDGIIADLRGKQNKSVADIWKQDITETEEQLRKGARVAIRNVKKVLGADIGSDGADKMEADEGIETQSGEGEELNYELRKSLRYAERGVKRMAKALPHEKA
ncbi:hypothetical protein NX059_007793 [Plenodomus lindquistii]|nr:hypothetical protein NX059_007793 [Plenodomus lindquistii]